MRVVTRLENTFDLDRRLSARLREGGKLYLLLDGARFDNVYAFLYQKEQNPNYVPLYSGTYFASAMEVSPCLAQIDDESAPLLRWALTKGMAESKALLLVADKGLKELSAHLRNFLEAKLPNMSIVLFRFYDPVVFNAMAHMHENAQLQKLLDPCTAVYWKEKDDYYGLEKEFAA